MQTKNIERGQIYYYDFGETEGSLQSGRRPVLVIQADSFNQRSTTVVVAAITGVIKKRYLPSHIILGERFGLSKPSMVLLEQIATINKEDLSNYIGCVDDPRVWKKINIAIKKTFGLWTTNFNRQADIRCLCPKCLQVYISEKDYVVKRLDPFAPARDKCDKCNRLGWDYIILNRSSGRDGND